MASAATSETATDLPALRRLHIDYSHSTSICVHKEKYFLLMTLDGIDFTFCSSTVDRTEPESLIHEFMTLTRLKIDCIRYDAAAEFAKSATFKAFCVNNGIAMEETAAYTHTFNARAEGALRIVKEHMRCLLRRANLSRRFWPYETLHFCRVYAYWPDKQGKSAWEKLDVHGPHALCLIAICTVSGHTSQVTCLARTLSWKMRRWTTELLKECGWATTSALPCSGCTRSSCARWYVSPATLLL
jgi:hypothetical protein